MASVQLFISFVILRGRMSPPASLCFFFTFLFKFCTFPPTNTSKDKRAQKKSRFKPFLPPPPLTAHTPTSHPPEGNKQGECCVRIHFSPREYPTSCVYRTLAESPFNKKNTPHAPLTSFFFFLVRPAEYSVPCCCCVFTTTAPPPPSAPHQPSTPLSTTPPMGTHREASTSLFVSSFFACPNQMVPPGFRLLPLPKIKNISTHHSLSLSLFSLTHSLPAFSPESKKKRSLRMGKRAGHGGTPGGGKRRCGGRAWCAFCSCPSLGLIVLCENR